jgi:transposase
VEGVDFDDVAQAIVVSVRPVAKARGRCGRCGRRCPRYDLGEGRRRWRALDLGTTKVLLEAAAPRVRCRTHGVTVAAVPWARHGAGHTRDFDDLAAWLAVRTSRADHGSPRSVQLQRRIRTHRAATDVALDTGLSQGLIESTNNKIRLLTRVAFGFHGHEPLIALAMLALGSHPPRLPGRS